MQIKASFDVVFILKILAVNYIFSRDWMLIKRNSSRSSPASLLTPSSVMKRLLG